MSRLDQPNQNAGQRAIAYALLSRALAYPDDPDLVRNTAGTAAALLEPSPVAELARLATGVHGELLEHAYIDVFSLSTSPDCPRFEAAYLVDDLLFQTSGLADITGFYRAFGVELTGSPMRADDITVELEFMAFLCGKEAYAREHLGPKRVRDARRAQRLFLGEHLGRWGDAFAQALAAHASAVPFYACSAAALAYWLHAEASLLRVRPDAAAARPRDGWQAREPISHGPSVFHPDELRVLDER